MAFSPLDKPVQFLKGVGPVRSEALGRMGVVTARDLLYHVPRRYDDASTIRPVASLEVGEDATAMGRIRSKAVIPTRSGLRIFQAILQDDSGRITCAWPGQPWIDRRVQDGDLVLVTGPVRFFHGRQIQPREFTVLSRRDGGHDAGASGTIFVAYPATEELPQWVLRGIFERNLDALLPLVDTEEYLTGGDLETLGLLSVRSALEALHRPSSMRSVEAGRRRLAFDELFFLQLVHAQVRYRETEAAPGIRFERSNDLIRPLHASLPFELTGAQARVLREIIADMTSRRRMNRLLQGDVGSGKTVVALFAMVLAVEAGYQAALMAPTELLAEQHGRNLGAFLEPLGMDVLVVTGRMPAAERRRALEALGTGTAPLVVGTHALIQEGIEFHRLGLAVVDEQQRFGVRQRMALGEQGSRPDVLIMSATPIPRSLAMTLYGDLDLSVLDEIPPGRKPVRTLLRYPSQRAEVYAFVEEQLEAGRQAYVVYPLVAESEKIDLLAASEEYERLSRDVFPHRRLGLLHGQLPADEKERVMRAFLGRGLDLIVTTSVVEVGIDISNATVMVIEHAERFGLSQLHQLRGRVGRGDARATCVLVSEVGGEAGERLRIFRDTQDGFAIAQADLQIRGPGDLFGAQQHGRDPILRFADLARDEDLLAEAQNRARRLVEADPELAEPAHTPIRRLVEGRYGERLRLFRVG